MLKKIDHLGIAVNSIEEALPLWVDGLGLKFLREEVIEDQKVKVAVLEDEAEHVELIEPLSVLCLVLLRRSAIHQEETNGM